MSERFVIVQQVIIQRTERPTGLRFWSDGLVQRVGANNLLPGLIERLDMDRELVWEDTRHLTLTQVELVIEAVRGSGIFDLEPRLLINYCKEDPGTAIWTANVDGRTAHVVMYDPRPRRNAELDRLLQALNDMLTQAP